MFKLQDEFDQLFVSEYKKYLEFHKELDAWRGKELDDASAAQVNEVLKRIQEQFIMLAPALNLFKNRAELAHKAIGEYEMFIDSLKVANAVSEVPKDEAIS